MAARAVVFRTTCPARARCPIACKPVLDRNVTLRRDIVVRAEAEPVPVSEDESGLEEVEVVDEVQEQRALREDKRQAQRSFQGKGGQRGGRNQKDAWENKIIQLNRVTKVLKGGKSMKFRACVVAGDKKGKVGVGVASAKEVVEAVERATGIAKANAIRVPMSKGRTFPHKIQIKEGAARVMLRPASEGTGVIAGGAVRVVLELAGYQNAFGKIYGTSSAMNNARGTIVALSQMTTWKEVAAKRDITIDFAMGRVSEPNEVVSKAYSP